MPKFNISKMFDGVDEKWIKVFTSDNIMPILSSALDALEKLDINDITPPVYDIFNFARATPYDTIKAVIIGQDPYPKKGDAHGLAFSSLNTKVPASLKNIYKCLYEQKLINSIPTTSDLTYWANQGVLLLNASLTTQIGRSNAHVAIWKRFTDELIKYISADIYCGPCNSLTFMLWGNFAQGKKNMIDDDCVVYEWIHPSPLAQNSATDAKKFVRCDHFSNVNRLLVDEMRLDPIDWNPTVAHIVFTDGACSNNGKGIFSSAGYSAYFSKGPLAGKIIYGKVPPAIVGGLMIYGTNQRGEGMGIIRALEEILKNNMYVNTTLVTDSNFWKEMIEKYMPNWARKGIDFKTKKNPDLTAKLYDLSCQIMARGVLNIIHVASHNKNPDAPREHMEGNSIADEYAVKGKELDQYIEIIERVAEA